MSDFEPGEVDWGPRGAPAQPPGHIPEGYVPLEWAASRAVVAPPDRPDDGPAPVAPAGEGPFLDRPGSAPVDKKHASRWFLYAIGGFIVGQLLALVIALIAGAIAGKTAAQMSAIASSGEPPEWYVASSLLGVWIGFVAAPWLASRTQGTRHFVADLGLRFRWIDLVGIAIGLGGQIAVGLLYAPFRHDIHNFNAPSQKLTGASHGGGFLLIALATVVVAPFAEELFFRGLLLKSLLRLFTPVVSAGRARVLGVVLAVLLDGLLFGLAHGEWIQLAGLALFGCVLAAISYRTGRLGMNMVSHATFNLVAVIALLGQRGLIH